MAISLVQKAVNDNAGATVSSITVTLPAATTAGNLLVAHVFDDNGVETITAPAGWTLIANVGAATDDCSALFYYANCPGGLTSFTFTRTGTQIWALGASVLEYSGIATASPLDQSNSASGNSATVSCGSITTTQANELLIFVMGTGNSSTFSGLTTGWVFQENDPTYSGTGMAVADRIVSATGTYAPTVTGGGSGNWEGIQASFKAAGGAATHTLGTSARDKFFIRAGLKTQPRAKFQTRAVLAAASRDKFFVRAQLATRAREGFRVFLALKSTNRARFVLRAGQSTSTRARFQTRAQLAAASRAKFFTRLTTAAKARTQFAVRTTLAFPTRARFLLRMALAARARDKFVLRMALVTRARDRFLVNTGLRQLAAVARARFVTRAGLTTSARSRFSIRAWLIAQTRARFQLRFPLREAGIVRFNTRVTLGARARSRFLTRFGLTTQTRARFVVRALLVARAQARFLVHSLSVTRPFSAVFSSVTLLSARFTATPRLAASFASAALLKATFGPTAARLAASFAASQTLLVATFSRSFALATPNTSIYSYANVVDSSGAPVTNLSAVAVTVTFPDGTSSSYSLGSGVTNSGAGKYTLAYTTKGTGTHLEDWRFTAADGTTVGNQRNRTPVEF